MGITNFLLRRRNHNLEKLQKFKDFINSKESFKVHEEIYHHKGFWDYDSKCGLSIYLKGDKVMVMFTHLFDNYGTSITNVIENLATTVYYDRLCAYEIKNIIFLEHYPANPNTFVRAWRNGTLKLVEMEWTGKRFKDPRWKEILNG